MSQLDWLPEELEANRPHLQAVACRMLGSLSDADDAVQEGWLLRADSAAVDLGTADESHGAAAVVGNFAGRARAARPADPDVLGRLDPVILDR
jgi:Sigma-70 region 2